MTTAETPSNTLKSAPARPPRRFYGWRVVGGAFVVAVFGWGLGFYGPPVYLSVVHDRTGWPLTLVSTAVTLQFLVGALVGANLPTLHRRFGVAPVTKAGALLLATGTLGWATANAPWQLFVAALLGGIGWGGLSAAALNAIVSPWFVRGRPAALGMAYNGGSIGGVVFSPLWVAAIALLGFAAAAAVIGAVMAVTIWILADILFRRRPEEMGLTPDGDAAGARTSVTAPTARRRPGALLWRDLGFLTLAAAMAFGLFAQIGLVGHLFSLLAPVLGAQQAGLAMGLATALAIAGRSITGYLMTRGADRRLVGCASYAAQMLGSLAFIAAAGSSVALLLLGIALFGIGFGNATSLPPLIAQVEFVEEDVPRVVALIVAIAQAGYAFAPAAFGLIRELAPHTGAATPGLFAAAASVQALAILALAAGRRTQR
jgi:Major Facilitator Superfamily